MTSIIYIQYWVLRDDDIMNSDIGSKFIKHMQFLNIQNLICESAVLLDPE